MTHHVVEHTTTLQSALPEPWHVRSAVLLGSASEIGASGEGCAARPDQLASTRDVGREKLVLEISRVESYARHQLSDLLRFRHISRERLFACESTESSGAGLYRIDNFFDVRDASLVGAAKPQRVDRWIGNHVAN